MTPFVLIADIDRAVIVVTRLVPRISITPWPGNQNKRNIKIFFFPMNSDNYKCVLKYIRSPVHAKGHLIIISSTCTEAAVLPRAYQFLRTLLTLFSPSFQFPVTVLISCSVPFHP
jgi:hypothetical protein